MALVLYGACLQETEQADEAPKAFKKATLVSPELPLAWKGLSSFYERQNRESDRAELLLAYLHLLKIETDLNKVEEWARKIGVLLSLLGHDTIVSTWNELSQEPDEKKEVCLKMMFSVMGELEGDSPETYLPLVSNQ